MFQWEKGTEINGKNTGPAVKSRDGPSGFGVVFARLENIKLSVKKATV